MVDEQARQPDGINELTSRIAALETMLSELRGRLWEMESGRAPEPPPDQAPQPGQDLWLSGGDGVSVSRTPDGFAVMADARGALPDPIIVSNGEIRWGKLTAAWTTGNTVTVNPCDDAGGNVDTGTTVTVYIYAPKTTAPLRVALALNAVIPFVYYYDTAVGARRGYALSVPYQSLPSNANKSYAMALLMTADNGTANDDPTKWGVDYLVGWGA